MTKVFPRVLNFRLIYLPLLGQFDLLKCLTVIFSPCTIFEVSPFLGGWGAVPPTVCGILAPQPGIEPKPLAVEARSLNHWTTRREVSLLLFFFFLYSFLAQVITDLCHNHPQEFASCSNGRRSPWALPLETNVPGNPDPRVPSKKVCKKILFECWLSMRLKIR